MYSESSRAREVSNPGTKRVGSSSDISCPKCGGNLVTAMDQVTANFPSPALERLVCSEPECRHVKYVKLDYEDLRVEFGARETKGGTVEE